MKLSKRLTDLEARTTTEPKYTARVFDNIDMPAQLHVHDSEGHHVTTFPNEAELDKYLKAEGIRSVFKVRRVRAVAK